ncbi:MAG: hypothetical protein EA408_11090 [Marinilabiliales bacterium]|nr:MAG: hypothetical protein EA408_11090 [Marinilabiliales bacterium]
MITVTGILGTGCVELGMIADNQPEDGLYSLKNHQHAGKRDVYIETSDDEITVWSYTESYDGDEILSLPYRLAEYDTAFIRHADEFLTLKTSGIDIDLLTVLFKYRPVSSGFPRQLNSDLSGALYIGPDLSTLVRQI